MTKAELKMILKLIDKNTTKTAKYDWDWDDDVNPMDGECLQSMNDEQITKLKADLDEVFWEG